jgi:hypothetical protein
MIMATAGYSGNMPGVSRSILGKIAMGTFTTLLARADALLHKRGITGHRAADRFVQDFKAYLVYFDATGVGKASATMDMLEQDSNLTASSILNTNFRCRLDDLISPDLRQDAIFPALFQILLDNNGKGVGGGELALPLILSDYRFSNDSDGVFDGDKKVEIKKNGASLKPVKTGVTEKGLIDRLNKKYFQGTVPGKKNEKLFLKHVATVRDASIYGDYFQELYVGCDVSVLSEDVKQVYTDAEKFNTAIGKFALREYKKVDNWNNIMYIDADRRRVVNICDPEDIDHLQIRFSPVMARNKDTQAIADGYVNVNI